MLGTLMRGMPRDGTWQERLERFYAPQARHYDDFRERLLHGRARVLDELDVPAGGRVLEIGGGTGRNLELLGARLQACASVELVDLCRPLLDVAADRVRVNDWRNVTLTHADATSFEPRAGRPDRVLFSYSLSMIPEWERALEHACLLLAPGGLLGVVDFHIPDTAISPLGGWFWQSWFRHSQVHLRRELGPALTRRLETVTLRQERGTVPYLPGLKAPYLIFVGRKAA